MKNILSFFRRENRAEYEENQAEAAVLAHPDSIVAKELLLEASGREMRLQQARDAMLRAEIERAREAELIT